MAQPQLLHMVMLYERNTSGDEVTFDRPRCVLYTLDPDKALACAKQHTPKFPERERWEDMVEIETAELDKHTF